MPRKIRNNKRRAGLADDAQAWLEGRPCGFFMFRHRDELEIIWNEHGDTDSMFWRRDMLLGPITRAELDANEDAWLVSGDDDKYGFNSYFIYSYYSDSEKQSLWSERGDKSLYRWEVGMRKPKPIDEMEDA